LAKLQEFHDKVKKRFYQPWGPEDEFKFLVQKALSTQLHKCEKRALIWEPEEPTRTLLQSASRNEFVLNIVKELTGFKKLDSRVSGEEPEKKRALASYFREEYLDRLLIHQVSLFFESGSTVAYVAKELLEPLSRAISTREHRKPSIELSTNNVLAYLLLWLSAKLPCTLFPWGPPEDTYGASFGSLADRTSLSPDYTLAKLDKAAKEEIANLLSSPYTLGSLRPPTLLLGATSGLQVSDDHKVTFKPEDEARLSDREKNEVRDQIRKCFGPHVGSYHNKVFKRFMYATKLPLMIFIAGNKIDSEIVVGKCHFVLDSEFTWEGFYANHPLAFCVGCKQSERRDYVSMFEQLGFQCCPGNPYSGMTAIIARNKQFIDQFEAGAR
jgi:hypothetical protein